MKVKKGDTVQVLSGNDAGKKGEVLEVLPKENKIVVKGINIRKKHVKPRKQGEQGGIIPGLGDVTVQHLVPSLLRHQSQ